MAKSVQHFGGGVGPKINPSLRSPMPVFSGYRRKPILFPAVGVETWEEGQGARAWLTRN